MALEAATYTLGFLISHAILYGSKSIDDDGTGQGRQYHMTDFIRTIPSINELYIQVSAVWSGVIWEDANTNDVLIDFTVDFWVNLGSLPQEKNWLTHFGNPLGKGKFYKGADPLMDPWWWVDPVLGNPNSAITDVARDPQMTVPPEAIGNSSLRHAQINVLLQHVSSD